MLDNILLSPSSAFVTSFTANYWLTLRPVGEGLLETGRIDDLRRWVDTCRPIMEKLGSPEHMAELAILEANLAIQEGRIDEGQAHLDQAIRWSQVRVVVAVRTSARTRACMAVAADAALSARYGSFSWTRFLAVARSQPPVPRVSRRSG